MTTLRMISLTVLLASALTLTACGGGGSAGDTDEKGSGTVDFTPPDHQGDSGGGGTGPTDEISEARARWDASAIADYDFVLQRSAFTPAHLAEPVTLLVRNRQVVSRVYVNSGLPVAAQNATWWPSIDGLFDILEAARDQNAAVLQVQFDAARGFPTQANIDSHPGLADDEHAFTVTNFAVR